jgi:hypothetical protein
MACNISPTESHSFPMESEGLKMGIELQQHTVEINGSRRNQFQNRAGKIQRGPVKMGG